MILCLDFDGVCHMYTSGWQGAAKIPDPPVPGLFDFLFEAQKYYTINIYSSRSNQAGGIDAMTKWFSKYLQEYAVEKSDVSLINKLKLTFPKEKPPAQVTLDDRAITFTGVWPSIKELKEFKPWNK